MVAVAVVQAEPVLFDPNATIDVAAAWTERAAASGAKVVVFPEAFVGGYPKGEDFGAKVGSRTPQGRALFERYREGCIDVPGPQAQRLVEMATDHGVHLVIGVVERDRGTLYCTALVIGDGRLLGKHRKLVPTASERTIWGRGDGSTLPVIDSPHGRLGAVICWENYMPLLRTAMYAKGVELYCAITVDDRDSWIPTVRHIAVEGRCFVLSACPFARRDGNVVIRGGSCIVDPFGELLAGPVYGEQAVLRADLDLGQIARGKYDLDVVGHYARPDVFELRVDERAKPSVSFEGIPPTSTRP